MAYKAKIEESTPLDCIKHKDKRVNIPTEELRGFVSEDDNRAHNLLYPRDPSLDPQLVWKGKDEQDKEALTVESVPIYIQEKIHPQYIINNVRRHVQNQSEEIQLFNDFNGIPEFEDKVDFYHHEQNWTNRMILGDSLQVIASLAEREGLRGKVQMIFMDPPYGIKFNSNWQVSTSKRNVKDGSVEDITRQPEQIKAFRDTWELGIHSYLSYMRDRLTVAQELLTESGSIFVQIGDDNVHLVRSLLDEVFGSENFVSQIVFLKTTGQTSKNLAPANDYLLWYAKDISSLKYRSLFSERNTGYIDSAYTHNELPDGKTIKIGAENEDGRRFRIDNITSQSGPGDIPETRFYWNNHTYRLKSGSWKTSIEGMKRLAKANRIWFLPSTIYYKRFINDFSVQPINNVWSDTIISGYSSDKLYVVQTLAKVIERCLLMATDPGDLVLDPTCGSGTTAYVAEQWGRRWITIDTSRVALTLTRTRLMSARYPYYLLTDSQEGIKKESELMGLPLIINKLDDDIRKGFVYRRVPHIMLKDIANNEEIDLIHSSWQEKLEPLRAEFNKLLKQSWQEWEMPRESEDSWPSRAKKILDKWWEYGMNKQGQIDQSIARNADTEMLYDQPYEDKKRIRVSGPFTMESLSPYRQISPAEERPQSQQLATKEAPGQFVNLIIENLRKAGVQNTKKNERLQFDRLEFYAGTQIHAEGELTESDNTVRRVAVCIGPEHGTVGSELIKQAAIEAVQGIGFDILLVCGFAFDPHVSEEVKHYGRLTVLPVRTNTDLTMGDAVLKKTGAGNLFMIFGEPDIDIKRTEERKVIVKIKGLDIYDPTTGQIRSASVGDIACWFIDTDYNGESFFVRQAYFTGEDHPYDRLKRSLRADIDEAAWSALYSTISVPFDPPAGGRIAIKVINNYGDEVLKVYSLN